MHTCSPLENQIPVLSSTVLAAKQPGPTPIRMRVALRHMNILSYVYRSFHWAHCVFQCSPGCMELYCWDETIHLARNGGS